MPAFSLITQRFRQGVPRDRLLDICSLSIPASLCIPLTTGAVCLLAVMEMKNN